MIEYRIDKEIPEYITMNKFGLIDLLSFKFPIEVYKEASDMICRLYKFKVCWDDVINEFKIRKESVLGKFLIENNGRNEIVDCTDYISYEDIREAYLISSFMNDPKMTNKILTLFQNQWSGFKEELLKEFPYYEVALNFILENNDFEKYLAKINQKEIEEEEKHEPFIVYEDGEWMVKTYKNESLNRMLVKQEEVSNNEI